MAMIRSPAVAGLFYPADIQQLRHDVQQLLSHAKFHDTKPKALIVPHAGYIYSGAIAATAYVSLKTISTR
ncbi:AmmeMemoRadiSam system protein B, partial [Nitrosomonas sp.]